MPASRALGIGLRSDEVYPSLILTVLLTLLYVVVLVLFGPSPKVFAFLPLLAGLILMVANLEFAFIVVIGSLFIDYPVSWFSMSVWVALPLALAAFWRFRHESTWDISTPLTTAIVFYGLCILPSLATTAVPFSSSYRLLNVLAFLVVLYGTIVSLRKPTDFILIVSVFLGFTVLNSLDVISEAVLLQRRSYGFAGIMFVDYSALGLCLAALLSIVSRGRARYLFGGLASLIAVALIMAQTRNTWISATITLMFLAGYLFRYPERAGLSRVGAGKLLLAGALVLGLSVGAALALNPRVQQRTADIASTDENRPAVSQAGGVSNSVVSRFLIWSTAYNAFRAHPVTGIGVYAFPFVSKDYSSIHPILYRRFVKNLTPHQTHVAVLAETGLIGFLGFVVFIVTALRLAFRSVSRAKDPVRQRIALVTMVAIVYAVVSMTFTDAWLWGPLIVLLGLMLGAMIANDKSADPTSVMKATGKTG